MSPTCIISPAQSPSHSLLNSSDHQAAINWRPHIHLNYRSTIKVNTLYTLDQVPEGRPPALHCSFQAAPEDNCQQFFLAWKLGLSFAMALSHSWNSFLSKSNIWSALERHVLCEKGILVNQVQTLKGNVFLIPDISSTREKAAHQVSRAAPLRVGATEVQ